MGDLGKWLIGLGGVLVAAGLMFVVLGKMNVPTRLPGDIVYRGKNTTFYFPLMTCIVLSVVLSVVAWVVEKLGR